MSTSVQLDRGKTLTDSPSSIFELNMLWYFVHLFFYFLFPSLFFGTRIQEKHGANVAKKDDYFNDD